MSRKQNSINKDNIKLSNAFKNIKNNSILNLNIDKVINRININKNKKEKVKELIQEQESKKTNETKDDKEKEKEQILFYRLLSFLLFT